MKEYDIHSAVEDGNEKIYVFQYDNGKRTLMIMLEVFFSLLGLFMMFFENIFLIIFGGIIFLIGLKQILELSLFKSLKFREKYLCKEWYFLKNIKIPYTDLRSGAAKRLWTGLISFKSKRITFFQEIMMDTEVFPIGNDGFRAIREILIEKKVIQGDENGWNY